MLVYFLSSLTLSLPCKLSSAKFLVCFNFQSASMLLKAGENVIQVSNSLYPDETLSYSASHLDPSCLHYGPWLCLMGSGLKIQLWKDQLQKTTSLLRCGEILSLINSYKVAWGFDELWEVQVEWSWTWQFFTAFFFYHTIFWLSIHVLNSLFLVIYRIWN